MNNPVKIAHIFDDVQISKSTIDLFEKLSGFEQYFIILSNNKEKWNALYQEKSNFQVIDAKINVTKVLQEIIEDNDVIILQALSVVKAKSIIQKKFKKKVFIWGLWGYGLYNIVNYFEGNNNQKYLTENVKKQTIIQRIKDYYIFNIVYKKAVKKIDICLFLLESDFRLLLETIPNKSIWMSTCYQTLQNTFGKEPPFLIKGNSILIGNSSTPSNQHVLVFNQLKEVDIGNRKLIVPLTIGDSDYRKTIIESATAIFSENFTPLINHLDLKFFMMKLESCSHVIMAHERQQAFGTIIMMMYAGAKVFMSVESPLYNWFKSKGIVLFSVENDLKNELECGLSDDEINLNKSILSSFLLEEVILTKLEVILTKAVEMSKLKKEKR